MRVSEGRGCLQPLPSGSILEQPKAGQLRVDGLTALRLLASLVIRLLAKAVKLHIVTYCV